MTVNLSALAGAGQQFFDNNGNPLSGGKLYSYEAGTTTPQTTYTSATGATAHTNPIILDSAGRVATGEIWLTAGASYKFTLTTSTDVLLANWDNITGIDGTGITTTATSVSFTGFKGQSGNVQDLADNDGSDWIGFQPSGSGAVATSAQDKMRQLVSVFDFMTPAQIADVQARTFLVDTIDAIDAAIAASPAVYFPPGGYLVSRAIALTGFNENGKTLYGSQYQNTIIKRTTTDPEVIGGNTVTCVMYVGGLDHTISNFYLIGAVNTIDGMFLNCARTTISDVRSDFSRRAFLAGGPYLCIFNRLWAKNASETGFDFSSSDGKTTLIFNNCTCENVGNGFLLTFAYYSVMNGCAADYVNYTATSNPYGVGYGDRASSNAIYQFDGGDVVMNGCGTENSFGNGIVGFGIDQSTNVTVNNCTAFGCASTYDPTATLGASWGVGPFQFGRGPANLTINGGRYTWTNAVAPVVADLVAFNYDQAAYGIRNLAMVNVGSTVQPTNLQNAFAGIGDFNRYCRIPINYRNQYTRRLSGTGTVITIPIVSQGSGFQRHVIRLLGVNDASNTNTPYGTEATIDFASLTVIQNISFWNSKNVASVAASGMNLQITLTSALTNPDIVIEPLSTNQKLIDLSNITIA